MKRFDLERYGKTYSIQITIATYLNGNLAIRMENWSNGEPELWNILTVNLGGEMPKDCAFIDTNNNGKDILAWIVRHGFAVPTGRSASSGFCCYPEYRFRTSKLKEIDPDGYTRYLQILEDRYRA